MPYLNSDPYEVVAETSADGTEDTIKVKLSRPMPRGLDGIAFDAANSLRSALDQAARACAVAGGKPPRNAGFPFGETKAEAEARRTGKSRNIPREMFDFMITHQPYKRSDKPFRGSENVLWCLNRLANTNKHEFLVPTGIVSGSIEGVFQTRGQIIGDFVWPPEWDASKNEMTIARVPHGDRPDFKLKVAFYMAFGEIEGIKGDQVAGVLNTMVDAVERAIDGIDAEARRIGLFK